MRIFGKGKGKLIANFSATMVTSLPSFSVSLSLSLSLSPKVPHAQYRKRFRASYNSSFFHITTLQNMLRDNPSCDMFIVSVHPVKVVASFIKPHQQDMLRDNPCRDMFVVSVHSARKLHSFIKLRPNRPMLFLHISTMICFSLPRGSVKIT